MHQNQHNSSRWNSNGSPESPFQGDRAGCLNMWVIFAGVISAISLLEVRSNISSRAAANLSNDAKILIVAVAILTVVSVFGIWKRKRWGVYIFVGVCITSLILELFSNAITATRAIAPILNWQYYSTLSAIFGLLSLSNDTT